MTDKANTELHPSLQFLILIAISLGCMIAGALIGVAVIFFIFGLPTLVNAASFNTGQPHVIVSIWILQITSGTIPLFLAPVIFARYTVNQPGVYLMSNFKILKHRYSILFFVLAFAIMFVSIPVMEFMINLNQRMSFPGFLKGVEEWMRNSEDAAAKETAVLLDMKTLASMLFNLVEIGLLTAIAEEFLFRGCIQTIFMKWTQNPHYAIWITAALFSAFHMQFFGFIPRMMLGVFFGYFVLWSGSIWTSVWGHFLNNGTAVLSSYLFRQKIIHLSPDDQHVFNYSQYALSLIITVFLLVIYRNIALTKTKLLEH